MSWTACALAAGGWSAGSAAAGTFVAGCRGGTGDVASLKAAINQANASLGPDVVQLGRGCTYSLTSVDNNWYGPNGLPPIASDITIEGNGGTVERAASAPHFRLFFAAADSTSGGYVTPAVGGGGQLTLRDVTLRGGLAKGGDSNGGGGGAGMGGAIFSQGVVVVDHSLLTGNEAQGGSAINASAGTSGGGIGTNASATSGGGFGPGTFGGGIGGSSDRGGGGGAGFAYGENGGDGNSPDLGSGGLGGGPETGLGGDGGSGYAPASHGGDGSGAGGSQGLSGLGTLTDGPGGGFGAGGGISPSAHSTGAGGGGVGGGGGAATSDSGGGGGGFGGGGGASAAGDGGFGGFGGGGGGGGGGPVSGGAPGFGGGSPSGTSGGGGAGMGGAIFNMQGTLTVRDSTFAGNTALGGSDNVPDHGKGIAGAVFNLSGTFNASGSTFAGNTGAYFASQIYNLVYDGHQARTAQTTLRDTIVSGGIGSAAWPYDVASEKTAYGLPAELGTANADVSQFDLVRTKNAQDDGTITGSPRTGDPALGPLQDNGGPTATMAPSSQSPVIDAGDGSCLDLAGAPLATDQRGALRPVGAACDIGAVEVGTPAVTTEPAGAVTSTSATLHALATNPDARAGSVYFEWGRTAAYGSATPKGFASAATLGAVIGAGLGSLRPATLYHFRAVLINAVGRAYGADETFTTAAAPKLVLGRSTASSAGVSFTADCHSPGGESCRATAVLTTLEHLVGPTVTALSARSKHTKRVVIGKASFSLRAGQTKKIVVHLNRAGAKLLARYKRIPATLTVTLLAAGSRTSLMTRTTIKASKKHKHHH